MKGLRLYLFPLAIFFLYHGCIKRPDYGTSGDYCSCYINGKRWEAGCDDPFGNCFRAELDTMRNGFTLECKNNSAQTIRVVLFDSTGLDYNVGTFILNGTLKGYTYYGYVGEYSDLNKSYRYSYVTDSTHTGEIKVSFDLVAKRVKGTFSFHATYTGGAEEMNVTGGEFSLPCKIDTQ